MYNTTKNQNYHIISVKSIPATNTQPSKVKITSHRFQTSKHVGYDNEVGSFAPALETAEAWLEKNGFVIIGHGEGKDCYYVITSTFKSLK